MTKGTLIWLIACCLWGSGAYAQATDQVTYYHTDAIGSVRMVTDATGAVVQRHDYLPFGEEYPTQPPDKRLFAGKERDQETGFDYFGARYYATSNGRFTTVDPLVDVERSLIDPQLWNRYAYSRNNPIAFMDPDGRAPLRIGSPLEQEIWRIAGAIRDTVASSLGADSEASPGALGVFGRKVVDSVLANLLPRNATESADALNAAILGFAAPLESGAAGVVARLKPVNLPAWRTVTIDMEEVISGHTSSGLRAVQSGMKSLFPDAMSSKQVESVVRNAYRYGKKIATQGDRVKIRGPWDGGTIELWLNTTTKTIETAYPIP